ncbi:MAG TPA: alpha/beta hydrolase [Candidatus Eisenbacteria bacterium]
MRRFLSPTLAACFLVSSAALFAGDLPLWSDSTGKGEPTIVLIHGAGSNRSLWDMVLPALDEKHRVVRVELPGHGASPMIGEITVKEVARAVDKALEREHVERALLVGHSYGAWVALEEAVANPKRVAGVAVIDMGSYTPQDTARTAALGRYIEERYPSLVRAIFEVMSTDPVECDSAVVQALRVPREVLSAYLRDAWRTDLRDRIHDLEIPIHVIAAEGSWPVTQPWERARHRFGYMTAGTAEGHRVIGSGHLIMRDRPDTLATILLQIAKDLPKR